MKYMKNMVRSVSQKRFELFISFWNFCIQKKYGLVGRFMIFLYIGDTIVIMRLSNLFYCGFKRFIRL